MDLEVVKFNDFFSNNPRLIEHSEELVKSRAVTGADKLTTSLRQLVVPEEHLITLNLIDAVGSREYHRLLKDFTEKREAGLLNDTQSSSDEIALRGVKMVVLPNHLTFEEQAKFITNNFGGEDIKYQKVESFDGRKTHEGLGVVFNNARFRAIEESGYNYDLKHIFVYGYLDSKDYMLGKRISNGFLQSNVVRLETLAGDLWQNPQYTSSGLVIPNAA